MSADEIRRLAEEPIFVEVVDKRDIGEGEVCDYSYEKKSEINTALLAFAEMVERCEKLIRPCNLEDAPCVPSDTGYCDSCDVPKHNDMINYILKGATGGTKC